MASNSIKERRLAAETQTQYLQEMGIQSWVRRYQPLVVEEAVEETVEEVIVAEQMDEKLLDQNLTIGEQSVEAVPSEPLQKETPVRRVDQYDWQQLGNAVKVCTACVLHESRTNTVFGVGNHQAQVMVIGEAPGADEDQQGEPFVGRAGKLLNNMLLAIGYKREEVYIANILKCRPPNNRDPRPEEIAQCEPFLKRQVELIQPRIIIAVGRIAAHNLLKVETPIGKMRGIKHRYGETPVVVTYHPAYLLRKPSEKAKAWDDLRFAMSVIQGNS